MEVADDRELLVLAEAVDGLALGPGGRSQRRISELPGGHDGHRHGRPRFREVRPKQSGGHVSSSVMKSRATWVFIYPVQPDFILIKIWKNGLLWLATLF